MSNSLALQKNTVTEGAQYQLAVASQFATQPTQHTFKQSCLERRHTPPGVYTTESSQCCDALETGPGKHDSTVSSKHQIPHVPVALLFVRSTLVYMDIAGKSCLLSLDGVVLFIVLLLFVS